MTEKDVFQFYNDVVKVIYCEVEARNNTLPVELLFEVHSAFDHLKRMYINGESENFACERAFSHLKRGVLDAFKLKLKYFNSDCKQLIKSKSDLRIIDNGHFLFGFLKDRNQIIQESKEARMQESSQDIDKAFEKWNTVSVLINEFEEKYFNSNKIEWAKRQSYFNFSGSFIIGIITGILASIIVWFITK